MEPTHAFLSSFSDLVHTTDSLRNAKLSVGKTEKESRNVDALVEPYKAENARIVRENNDLHQQLLRQKEEKDRETRGWLHSLMTLHPTSLKCTDRLLTSSLRAEGLCQKIRP